MQTADTAALVGLSDRGTIRAGLRADLNVIDYDRLSLARPVVAHDLPPAGPADAESERLCRDDRRRRDVTYRDGEPTALPGCLLRGAGRSECDGGGLTRAADKARGCAYTPAKYKSGRIKMTLLRAALVAAIS